MKVLVLGLGWLGKDLALRLNDLDYEIVGTKRQIDSSITAIKQIVWNTEEDLPNDMHADICIITLTPSSIIDLKKFEKHIDTLKQNGVKKIIYTSSTGVYEGHENIVDENTVLNLKSDRQKKLFEIEQIVLRHKNSVVLRLGGLVGEDRNPAKFLAAKKNVSGANQVVNMVHKIDVINIIVLLITSKFEGIMNVVSSSHQTREEYYTKLCDKLNLVAPEFNSDLEPLRIVSNELSKKILNYNYQIDDTLKHFLS